MTQLQSDSASKLPVQHPDFRYRESWNPYWKALKLLESRVFSDNETENHPSHWREKFNERGESLPSRGDLTPSVSGLSPAELATRFPAPHGRRPLHVEIGCNGGHVILEWAARNPSMAFIGLDWKFKQIFLGAEKARKRGIENLLFFRAHAERLIYMFGHAEIDHLYLYFPDPWAKKSQWKNRWLTRESLLMAASLVRKGGTFHIKTDHAGYFEWMENELAQAREAWKVAERSNDLHASHPSPEQLEIPDVTLFERIFIRKQIRIHHLLLERL